MEGLSARGGRWQKGQKERDYYFGPTAPSAETARPLILTEYGGARSKATFVLLSGVIEVTSEGGKRGRYPPPSLHPAPSLSTSNPPTRTAPLHNRPHVLAAEVNGHVVLLFSAQSPRFEREPLSGSSLQHTERLLRPLFFWRQKALDVCEPTCCEKASLSQNLNCDSFFCLFFKSDITAASRNDCARVGP